MEALIISEKFVYCSYRVEQVIVIRFHKSGLSNEFKISKNFACHRCSPQRNGVNFYNSKIQYRSNEY